MPSVFEDVTFTYKGQDYTVKHNQILPLIEIIESIIPVEELVTISAANIPRAKLARAYVTALEYAGHKDIDVNEVYAEFMNPENITDLIAKINGLVALMVPPSLLKEDKPEEQPAKKPHRRTKSQ